MISTLMRALRRGAGLRRAPVVDERQGVLFDAGDGVDDVRPYLHPQATRRIVLCDVEVGYALTRARRRSIGMVVGAEGLSVRAPRWVSLADVETALQERAAWIVKHLASQRQRAAKLRARDDAWVDGGIVRVMGERVTLKLDTGISADAHAADARGARVGTGCVRCEASWAGDLPPPGATLRVGLAADADSHTIRAAVEAWLQAQARLHFAQRCALYAPMLNVTLRRMSLSSARTRWGSAGVDGAIRLNWRLMHHTPACIDYVVVHELAHLRHMNHGAAFWRLVESVLPDHRAVRRQLRDDTMQV